jgi:hypothetical protein
VKATAILHNLIIDFEKQNGTESDYVPDNNYQPKHPFEILPPESGVVSSETLRIVNLARVQNAKKHAQLQHDLMHHIWMARGNEAA